MKIFSFLKNHKINFVIALVLLLIQANLELTVPGIMSDIVDIGIARGGLTGAAPAGATAAELAQIQTSYILSQGGLMLGVTLLTFAMLRFAAGDAVELLYENLGTSVSQAVLDAKRAELGLDQPFFVQYGRWLWDLLHGDLGTSYVSGVPVLPTLLSKVPATLLLTGASLGLTILLSVPLGIVSAVFHGRWIDYLIRAVSFVGNSLPNFFAALLLLLIFAVKLRWLPVIDLGGGGSLVLPSVTLALAMSSRYTRQIRAAVLEELEQDYVTGALARGVGRKTVLLSNVLRAALPGGLTDFVLVFAAQAAGTALGVSHAQMCTVASLVLLGGGLAVLWRVCCPFTPMHAALWGGMLILGAVGAVALGPWIGFAVLDVRGWVLLAALWALTPWLLRLFTAGVRAGQELWRARRGRPE